MEEPNKEPQINIDPKEWKKYFFMALFLLLIALGMFMATIYGATKSCSTVPGTLEKGMVCKPLNETKNDLNCVGRLDTPLILGEPFGR